MSDTKTRDPESKLDEQEKERLRERFSQDQDDAKKAETERLENDFAAPAFTPPHEAGDTPQPETGDTPQPNSGDTPISDSAPEDSQSGGDSDGGSGGGGGGGQQKSPTSKQPQNPQQKGTQKLTGKAAKRARGEMFKKKAQAVAKKAAKQAIKRGADAAAPGSGELAGELAESGGKVALAGAKMLKGNVNEGLKDLQEQVSLKKLKKTIEGPVKMVVIIVVAAFFILVVLIFMAMAPFMRQAGEDELKRLAELGSTTLTVTKSTDDTDGIVNPSDVVTFTIHAVSTVPTTNIVITDKVPTYTTLDETDPVFKSSKGTYSSATRTITWNSKDLGNATDATVSFKVRVNSDVKPMSITNVAYASSEGGEGGALKAVTCTGSNCALNYVVSFSNISAPFGQDRGTYTHKGIDLAAGLGTPIYALESGVVSDMVSSCTLASGENCGGKAGNYVFIRSTNRGTQKYMHMQRTAPLKSGDPVTRGQVIGYVNSTGQSSGNHLHFQIENPGPVNPETVLANWPN